MIKKLLFSTIVLITTYTESVAQGTAGKDFWVAFMAQDWGCYYNNSFYNNDTAELFISSQFATKVTVTAPGQSYSKTFTLQPNVTFMLQLPREVVCRYSDSVTTNGVNIKSDTTINVYAVNRYWFSKGATVVIPTTSIVNSPEYFITTNYDAYTWGWWCNGKSIRSPEFTIVGIADSSVIEIVPTGASSRRSVANVPFQVTLKKGQTFQYMTTDGDLTGSVVRSKYINSKYAVFAGNRQSYSVRSSGAQTCWSSWDHIYEQMMPTVTWGNEYTAMPFKNNLKGYTLKIVAAENNTNVTLNGNFLTSLNQGQYYTHEVYNDTMLRIAANNRISVAQFAIGGYSCGNHPTKQYVGDPAMMMLFPDEQFGQNATINTVSQTLWWWWSNNWWWQQNGPEHYINVMTKSIDTAEFEMNNAKINQSLWQTNATFPDYHFAQIKVDSGSHYLKSNKGFLAYVYGYLAFEGYAFAAAANFKPIQNNFMTLNAQCVRDTVTFQAVTNDSFVNYFWTFGDNTTGTGPKIKHKYRDTGWYTVKMYCYHKRTNEKDSVTKNLYISDTKIKSLLPDDIAICGKVDMAIFSKGFDYDNEYVWNDGHPVYYKAVKAPGIYWLEVKERNGCVYRDSLNVTASSVPKANFLVSEDSFCLNRNINVKFTNRSTFQFKDSIKSYIWDFADTMVTTMDTVLYHKFKRSNMYPVLLRATTVKGCFHDTFMLVDVLPAPKANFVFTRKDTCFNNNAIELKNNTVIKVNDHRRFKWFFSEGFVISNSNPGGPRKYTDSGKFKVSLIYENLNGCIDTMVKSVEIVPNPKAAFNIPNATYCSRDTIPLNSSSYSTYLPLTYQWNWGDSVTSQSQIGRHAYVRTGTYKVKLSVWSPKGCRDTIVKSIFVNETPIVDFMINNDSQCLKGHDFDFTNTTRFKGSLNYTWTLGDGSNSSDSNLLNKTFIKDSVYTVKLSTTSTVGCYAEKSAKVYLGGYPNVNFSTILNKQCFRNNSFDFNNMSNMQRGNIVAYHWTFGNGDSAKTSNISQYNYKTEDSFVVRLIGVSNLGCRDTAHIGVVTFPQGKAGFNINDSTQCLNQNAFLFSNTSSIKKGTMSYRWGFGDNTISDSVNGKKVYTTSGNYRVKLTSNSQHGCIDTMSKMVFVHASPKAAFNVNKVKQCFRNHRFDLNNTSTLNSGSFSAYDWNLGDLSTETSRDVTGKQYNSEDSFDIQLVVTTDQGCKDTTGQKVIVHPQPSSVFTVNNNVQCFKQHSFQFANQSTISEGSLVYQWQFGDATTATSTNPTKKYGRDSVYQVRLISSSPNQCHDTAYQTLVLNVSPDALFDIDKDRQCFKGNLFNFTNRSTVRKGQIVQYTWDPGDGNTSNNLHINNYQYNTEDSFNVSLIAISDQNCEDTLRQLAVTFAQPNVNFVIPNDSQCWQKNYFVIQNNTTLKYGQLSNYWNFGDNTSSTDYLPMDKSYPNASASYIIRYKAVSDHGCSDSAQKRVALLERPISNFGINDSIQCFNGHLFSFNNTTSFSAMYSLSYWWDYANGNKNTGFTPQDATYANPGLYNMSLVSYSSLTNCYDTIIKTLIPAPHANVQFTMNNDSQCFRFNRFVMNNASNIQFGNMKYLWKFGDATRDTAKNPTKSYSNEGSYQIRLVVSSNYGCQDSLEKPIGFYASPKAAFSINDIDQCLNAHNFDFKNLSSISRGSFTQNWWFDDLASSTSTDYIGKQFITAEDHQVRLSLLSDKGCSDTLLQKVYLENIKNSEIIFNENDSQCLRGNAFTFTANKLNSKTTFTSYKWIYGDGQESNLQTPSKMTFLRDSQYTVLLVTGSALGCQDTVSTKIVIHPHPVADFTNVDVCYPEPIGFVNTSTIKSGKITSYLWDFGDNNNSGLPSPLHAYKSAGTYHVQLTAFSEYNCSDLKAVNNAATVLEKPRANFSFAQLPTIQQDQTRFQLNNLSSANAMSYSWDFGNQSGSTDEDPIALYQDTGRYWITLIAYSNSGCSDTLRKNTGLIIPDFFYYLPNAFSPNEDIHNKLYRGLGTAYVYSFKLEIFNRWGEKLFETDDIYQGWDGYYNGELCMEGAYLCRVQIVPFKGTLKTFEQMFMLMR